MKKRGINLFSSKRSQEGPIGMSFGVIFAIILIIFILAIAIYVIVKFMGIKSCSELGLFKNDLQTAVSRTFDTAGLEGHQETFNYTMTDKITSICFVNTSYVGSKDINYIQFQKYFGTQKKNVFFLPLKEACDDFKGIRIEHLNIAKIALTGGYKCFAVKKGKFNAIVKINLGDHLVTIA